MFIENSTKERFVKMLSKRQIVVVYRDLSQKSITREFKFIGMQNGMKWDFTHLIINATGCKTNGKSGYQTAARGWNVTILLEETLKSLKEQGYKVPKKVLQDVGDYIASFGM